MNKLERETKLPDLGLIQRLHQAYYVEEVSADGQISSHWKQCSEKLKFRLGEKGIPDEVSGYGFGDLELHRVPYKLLCYVFMASHLVNLADRQHLMRVLKGGLAICRRMGLSFAQDAFRQVRSLALIETHLSSVHREKHLRVIIIGDGYGFFASLFRERHPNSTIVLIDLGKILVFQAYYCQKAHPDKVHQSVLDGGRLDLSKCDFVYCPAEFLTRVSQFKYDVAVNIASMQEMTKESLVGYFEFLRQHMVTDGLFYCCNRERKVLIGGEIVEFREYPWHPKDVHLVDEGCPWHKYYASFTTTSNGPRVLGMRVPFVNYYDGPTWHRLSRLHTMG